MANYSDDFNRADGAIGGAFLNGTGTMVVASNMARSSSSGITAIARIDPGSFAFAAHQRVGVSVHNLTTDALCGPAARVQSSSGFGYSFITWSGTGNARIFRRDGINNTPLSTGAAVSDDDFLEIEVVDDAGDVRIIGYINGVEQQNVLDPENRFLSGQPGFYSYYNTGTPAADNFSATDEFGGGQTLTPDAIGLSSVLPASALSFGGVSAEPDAVVIQTSVPAPALSADGTVTPAVLSLLARINQALVDSGYRIPVEDVVLLFERDNRVLVVIEDRSVLVVQADGTIAFV